MPVRLADRSVKPREQGITHVLDRGLSVAQVDGMIEVAGAFVDIVKLGWGTAVATQNLEPQLARYRVPEIPKVLSGTPNELAIRQERVEQLLAWLRTLGIERVEI